MRMRFSLFPIRTWYDVFYHALRHSLCEQLKNNEKRADISCVIPHRRFHRR